MPKVSMPQRQIVRIKSDKHPGAIFFKYKDTKNDFICKFYPDHEEEARLFEVFFKKELNG